MTLLNLNSFKSTIPTTITDAAAPIMARRDDVDFHKNKISTRRIKYSLYA